MSAAVYLKGDPVWVSNGDWCASKSEAIFLREHRGGNCVVFDLHNRKDRKTHVNSLTPRTPKD